MANDLRITDLSFRDFRNYRALDLHDIGSLTVFVGKNGVGKTNILEGIQLLSACTSFKHPTSEQLIRAGAEIGRIQLSCTDGNRDLQVALGIQKGHRKYTLNGKTKTTSELKGVLPAVTFTPDDLALAKKSSGVKRDALDELGGQLTKNYHVIVRDYEKVVRYKNRLLKEGAPIDLIRSINDTLVTVGAQLVCYRTAIFKRILPYIAASYAGISSSSEVFTARYVPSWEEAAQSALDDAALDEDDALDFDRDQARALLEGVLEARLGEECDRGRSLVGPHADKISFALSGKDVSSFASQGQQRSVVLACKVAEVNLIRETTGQNPILLLDDVMSELDEHRRAALVSFVENDIQTFITTTNVDYLDSSLMARAQTIHLPFATAGEEPSADGAKGDVR